MDDDVKEEFDDDEDEVEDGDDPPSQQSRLHTNTNMQRIMNDLPLSCIDKEQSLRLKVRQHVNPLSSKYQVPVNLPGNWMCDAFEDAQRPLIIDIGCAKGTGSPRHIHSSAYLLGLSGAVFTLSLVLTMLIPSSRSSYSKGPGY